MVLPNELYEQVILLLLNSWIDQLLQPKYYHRIFALVEKTSPLRSDPRFSDVDYPDTLLNFARSSITLTPRIEFYLRNRQNRILYLARTENLALENKFATRNHLECIQGFSFQPEQFTAKSDRWDDFRQSAHGMWSKAGKFLAVVPRIRDVLEEVVQIKKRHWRERGITDYVNLKTELEDLINEENRDYREQGWMLCESRLGCTNMRRWGRPTIGDIAYERSTRSSWWHRLEVCSRWEARNSRQQLSAKAAAPCETYIPGASYFNLKFESALEGCEICDQQSAPSILTIHHTSIAGVVKDMLPKVHGQSPQLPENGTNHAWSSLADGRAPHMSFENLPTDIQVIIIEHLLSTWNPAIPSSQMFRLLPVLDRPNDLVNLIAAFAGFARAGAIVIESMIHREEELWGDAQRLVSESAERMAVHQADWSSHQGGTLARQAYDEAERKKQNILNWYDERAGRHERRLFALNRARNDFADQMWELESRRSR